MTNRAIAPLFLFPSILSGARGVRPYKDRLFPCGQWNRAIAPLFLFPSI
ncbi:hypothetical protein [Coleofasciculus sp. F4-SAH-05]